MAAYLLAFGVCLAGSASEAPIHVVVAGSRAHYTGMIAAVASATNATGAGASRLHFLLLVNSGEAATEVEAAARCAGGETSPPRRTDPREG